MTPHGPPPPPSGFEVKDSGKRKQFSSGMQRDVTEGKTNWALIADGPMLARWAEHLTKGAVKYDPRNWMKAAGQEELDRFRESAFRHFMQWYLGEMDEDHASAVFFNINGAEYVRERMGKGVGEGVYLSGNYTPHATYRTSCQTDHPDAQLKHVEGRVYACTVCGLKSRIGSFTDRSEQPVREGYAPHATYQPKGEGDEPGAATDRE